MWLTAVIEILPPPWIYFYFTIFLKERQYVMLIMCERKQLKKQINYLMISAYHHWMLTVSSNTVHGEAYSTHHYVIKFVSDLQRVGVFSGYCGGLPHKVEGGVKHHKPIHSVLLDHENRGMVRNSTRHFFRDWKQHSRTIRTNVSFPYGNKNVITKP
jgi:hypothetical protein